MAQTDREGTQRLTPPPMLTVAAVARRLGVAPSTLRTWDRRYDLGPSAHTAGSHRRYSPQDLERLIVMRRLTLEGVPPSDAARIAVATPLGGADRTPAAGLGAAVRADVVPSPDRGDAAGLDVDPDVDRPGAGPGRTSRPPVIPRSRRTVELGWGGADSSRRDDLDAGWPFPATPQPQPRGVRTSTRSGGGRVVALPDGSPAARGLARAAMSLDSAEVYRIFGDAVRAAGVRGAWDGLAMPVLQSIGERWRLTGDGIDVEHAFSEAVMAVLHGVTATLGRARNVRPVVLTCAEGDYHTLPLHALAAALAEVQVGVRLLGVGMPAPALVAAVRRSGPAAVFLYARLPVADVAVLDLLPRQRPAPRLVVGGPGWGDRELPPHVTVARTLDEAVDDVLAGVDP